MFYARPEAFDAFVAANTGPPWQQAFDVRWLDTEHLDGIEPFGFADGTSACVSASHAAAYCSAADVPTFVDVHAQRSASGGFVR